MKGHAPWLGVRKDMLHGWEYERARSMVGVRMGMLRGWGKKGHAPWFGVREGMVHGWG